MGATLTADTPDGEEAHSMHDSAVVYLRGHEILEEPPEGRGYEPEIIGVELSVPLDDIERDPKNRRVDPKAPRTLELAESIRQHGVTTRIELAENPPDSPKRYRIIAGERRWRASRIAGLTHIPAKVVKHADRETKAVHRLIENLQREDLNIVERGEAFQDFINQEGLSQGEAARRLAVSKATISKALAVLSLPSEALDLVRQEQINREDAYQLARLMEAPDGTARVKAVLKEWQHQDRPPGLVGVLAARHLADLDGDKPKRGRPPKAIQGRVVQYFRKQQPFLRLVERDKTSRKVDIPGWLVERGEQKFGRYKLREVMSAKMVAWLEEETGG